MVDNMTSDSNDLDQLVVSERQLIDLFEPLLELLRTHSEEHHIQRDAQRELVYWQTRPIMLDEDGELRIVTMRTVPSPPDRDLNHPVRRVEFFEKRELQVDIEGTEGLLRRLIVGSWGEGATLYTFDGGSGQSAPFTRREFEYYRRLITTAAETLSTH